MRWSLNTSGWYDIICLFSPIFIFSLLLFLCKLHPLLSLSFNWVQDCSANDYISHLSIRLLSSQWDMRKCNVGSIWITSFKENWLLFTSSFFLPMHQNIDVVEVNQIQPSRQYLRGQQHNKMKGNWVLRGLCGVERITSLGHLLA